jgi:sortase B
MFHCLKTLRAKPHRLIFAVVLALCLGAAALAVWNLHTARAAYSLSQAEYAALRAQYSTESASSASAAPEAPLPAPEPAPSPAEVNPDYVGWVRIAGTLVDYPVARGRNNRKYLSTTFMGETGKAGSIFMDYRCKGGFDDPYTMLYGHNMKDGSMFSALNHYLEPDWPETHQEIAVTAPDGAETVYRVFSVRLTDVYDAAYALDFADAAVAGEYFATLGAPADARVITLSTCTNGGDKNARLLIHAAQFLPN